MDALEHLLDQKNIDLFEKKGVLTERELRSREEILVEQYFLTINIEGETTESVARRMILPAAIKYFRELAESAEAGKEIGIEVEGILKTAKKVGEYIDGLNDAIRHLIKQNKELGGSTVHEKAVHMRENIIPAMEMVRYFADRLERSVDHDMWPLPTYKYMLFVK